MMLRVYTYLLLWYVCVCLCLCYFVATETEGRRRMISKGFYHQLKNHEKQPLVGECVDLHISLVLPVDIFFAILMLCLFRLSLTLLLGLINLKSVCLITCLVTSLCSKVCLREGEVLC